MLKKLWFLSQQLLAGLLLGIVYGLIVWAVANNNFFHNLILERSLELIFEVAVFCWALISVISIILDYPLSGIGMIMTLKILARHFLDFGVLSSFINSLVLILSLCTITSTVLSILHIKKPNLESRR